MKQWLLPSVLVFIVASLVLFPDTVVEADDDSPEMLVKATNPDPQALPSLAVWQWNKELRVAATFPNVPGFTFDSWCYESELDCVGILALDGGRIELRHLDRNNPEVVYVTIVTPEPGAVEFKARAELAPGARGPLPNELLVPNMCWQLKRAPAFASRPDPYPEFVKRCFVFTKDGLTFLDKTRRNPIPVRSLDEEVNNPPWVQMYVGVWQEIPETRPTAWADHSPDQYTTTVIGTVSRDGRHLAALVTGSSSQMCQAWHDCMHNNPDWTPADADPGEKEWRAMVYVMENNPDELLARAKADFPEIHMHEGAR